MNKAVPRSVKDFRFETRHIAREAARRQRKSLDEWLHDVMSDYAADLGIDEYELGNQERIDAVASTLERLSERDCGHFASAHDAIPSRSADRDHDRRREDLQPEETELVLEDAITVMQQRFSRDERSGESMRHFFPERPAHHRSGRDPTRPHGPRSYPFEGETIDDRHPTESQNGTVDVESGNLYWKFGDKLNAILEAVQTRAADGARNAPPVSDRRLGPAIADVRKRQRVLDQAGRAPQTWMDGHPHEAATQMEVRVSAAFAALQKKIASQETAIDGLCRAAAGERGNRSKLAGDLTTLCTEISDTLRNLRSRGGVRGPETSTGMSLDKAAATASDVPDPSTDMPRDPGPDAGATAFVELRSQVESLANQFERSKDHLTQLASIERSMRDLFEHQSAARSRQGEAESRTTLTFNAVHDAMSKIVERLTLIDAEVTEVRIRQSQIPPKGTRVTAVSESRSDLARDVAKAFAESAGVPSTASTPKPVAPARRPPLARPVMVEAAPSASSRSALVRRTRAYIARQAKPMLTGGVALMLVASGTAAVYSSGIVRYYLETNEAAASSRIASTINLAPSRMRQVDSERSHSDVTSLAVADPIQTRAITTIPSFVRGAMPRQPAARSRLKALAEAGNGAAQYELGIQYCDTDVGPRDFALAAQWFQKAADQDIAPAQYRLASLYEKGLGVPHDANLAKALYLKAAEAGHPRAMHNLAVLLVDGNGKPDYEAAATWFRKAAQFGVRDSQYNLGILLGGGLGVPQSLVQSYAWFTIAAAQNDSEAAKKRDEVRLKLTAEDLATARALAASFRSRAPDAAAIQVQLAPGEETTVAKLVP